MMRRHRLVVCSTVCALAMSALTTQCQAHACGVVTIPALFAAQRAFAVPVAAADMRTLRFWVDSDGSGFIFDDVARQYGTVASNEGGHARAYLPRWAASASTPPLTGHAGTLGVMPRAGVARDPMFAGLAGQLGASWLQKRVWTFDYPMRRLLWRCDGTEPDHARSVEVPLSFALDAAGHLVGGVQYPQLEITVEGKHLIASLDTAATVALSKRGVDLLGGSEPTQATSFATHALVTQWHGQHPSWPYLSNAGQGPGIDAVRVPQVVAGSVRFANVWFTTRPGDDVFEGEQTQVKLGPSAFGCCVLTIDYVRRRAIVQRPGD